MTIAHTGHGAPSHLSSGGPRPTDLYAYRDSMNVGRVAARSSALIIIDLQRSVLDPDFGWLGAYSLADRPLVEAFVARLRDTVVPNVRALQTTFRAAGAPVLFLTFGTVTRDFSDMPPRMRRAAGYWKDKGISPLYATLGGPEIEVIDEIAPLNGETVIRKASYSGFTGTPLEHILRARAIQELVICGQSTEACVEATLRSAIELCFDCVLVSDACASLTDASHELAVRSMEFFSRIATTEAIVGELAGQQA